MTELKPCDCGNKDIKVMIAKHSFHEPDDTALRGAICFVCGHTVFGKTEEQAIEAWNERSGEE